MVKALAEARSSTSLAALDRSIASAARVDSALADNNWALMDTLCQSGEAEAINVRDRVLAALNDDELVTNLAEALGRSQQELTEIIQRRRPPATPPNPDPVVGKKVIKKAQKSGLSASEAKSLLKEIEESFPSA